jgi:NAD+ synthase (glutamine-hydrolysing)
MGEFIEQCLIIETDELFIQRSPADMKRVAKEQQETNETEQIRKALVLGLKDYAAKTGFAQVLLGVSGGIDSAVVASLAVEAMGAENVYLVMMPSEFTSKDSTEDAQELAKNLGVGKDNYRVVSIKKLHQEMRSLLPDLSDNADENIQPRLRAALLMAMANSLEAIVLSTGNKSEIAVGYCTLYGDTCGALSIIGDLLKHQVYDLARLYNAGGKEIIPQRIINREPTAELRHDQKDSDSLPSYEILDEIVYLYVQELKTITEMMEITNIDKAILTRVLNMIDAAEHKRYQLPPVIKVAGKTFGAGRRMPIAHGYVLT